jgi:ABC-type antimicrobial peptide transport system permease subunit
MFVYTQDTTFTLSASVMSVAFCYVRQYQLQYNAKCVTHFLLLMKYICRQTYDRKLKYDAVKHMSYMYKYILAISRSDLVYIIKSTSDPHCICVWFNPIILCMHRYRISMHGKYIFGMRTSIAYIKERLKNTLKPMQCNFLLC